MQYPVIVRSEPEGRYVARPVGLPEIEATATTEAAAIEQVRQELGQWLRSAKLVQVDVPAAPGINPWLETFGRSADDPDFDDLQRELSRLRSERGAE